MTHPPRRPHLRRRERAGLTLIEIMVTVTMLVLIFAAAVPLFHGQARAVTRHAGRADAIQRARFAAAAIERELRVAGPPTAVQDQPLLVQADPLALTVNADLNSRDSATASAVYFDPDVDTRETQSLTVARAVRLPLSSVTYPVVDYRDAAGVASDAETISFWASRDPAATRNDQYNLWRRVNNGDSTIVTRSLIIRPGRPLFVYLQPGPGDTLRPIDAARLPALHSIARHGAAGDVGTAALVDSVREVQVVTEVLYTDPKRGDTTYTATAQFRLLNAGLARRTTCGTMPRSVALAASALAGGVVRLTWARSVDDSGGEQDARRYLLFRRRQGTPDWGEPFHGLAARGMATYTHDDTDAKSAGEWWEYSLMVQDCTPTNSARTVAPAVQIP